MELNMAVVTGLQVSWRRECMLVWPLSPERYETNLRHETSFAMKHFLTVLAAAAAIAAAATPAAADGIRRASRGSAYIGAISRNVITPYYYGYYPGHYSYSAPDPVYYRYYVSAPGCWRWIGGYRYRVC
jgi:hypothetical protein